MRLVTANRDAAQLKVSWVQGIDMTTTLAEPESAVGTPSSQILPGIDSEEYKLLYLPTMLAVYTARHQRMPQSDTWLHRHVFGSDGHLGCDACREETEFLVAHQKKFF